MTTAQVGGKVVSLTHRPLQGYNSIHKSWKTSSAKRNGGRKPKLCDWDHRTLKRIVSKNYRTAAEKVRAELNVHREDLASTKTDCGELLKSKIHVGAEIAKPLIIEDNAKRRKR